MKLRPWLPWLLLVCIATTPALACSTFVLHDEHDTIIGHHLDERGYVPGLVVINNARPRAAGSPGTS